MCHIKRLTRQRGVVAADWHETGLFPADRHSETPTGHLPQVFWPGQAGLGSGHARAEREAHNRNASQPIPPSGQCSDSKDGLFLDMAAYGGLMTRLPMPKGFSGQSSGFTARATRRSIVRVLFFEPPGSFSWTTWM